MNAEVFGEWLRRRGHRVIEACGSFWFEQAHRVFQAFPYHWLIHPEEYALQEMLRHYGMITARYSTPLEAPYGLRSYHAIYEAPEYNLEMLSKWTRKNVRRGLSQCRIEPITFERLATEGWKLQSDTLARQGRYGAITRPIWEKLTRSAATLPGFEAWGALVGQELAAAVIVFPMVDAYYLLYQSSRTDLLSARPNNALCYVLTHDLLSRPGARMILYGLHSLDAPASVDEFKFRMGYSPKPVRQRAVFHPAAAPLINRFSHTLLRAVSGILPYSPLLAKAEGMMRFYIQGKLTLAQQPIPGIRVEGHERTD